MPKVKEKSNMYDWCDMTVNPLYGKPCSHKCKYCFMLFLPFCNSKKYQGDKWAIDMREIWKIEKTIGKTIFVGSATDMFAEDVPWSHIKKILMTCIQNNSNIYLLQSKNTPRLKLSMSRGELGIEVREKSNLLRLKNRQG